MAEGFPPMPLHSTLPARAWTSRHQQSSVPCWVPRCSRGGFPHHVPDGVWPVTCQGCCGLGTQMANAALSLLCACFRNQTASLPQHKHQISMREKKHDVLLYLVVGYGGSSKDDDSVIFVLIGILHALLQSSLLFSLLLL